VRIEKNNNWVLALMGPMHLDFINRPILSHTLYKIIGALFHNKVPDGPPRPSFLISLGPKRRNKDINIKKCLLPEFLLTGALRRILIGILYCRALLKLYPQSLLRVQKEGTQV